MIHLLLLLSFSQTCYVSAGSMQACPGLISRISIFLSRHFSIFFFFFNFPSVEVIPDKLTSTLLPLLTVRTYSLFSLQIRGSHDRKKKKKKGIWRVKGEKNKRGGNGGKEVTLVDVNSRYLSGVNDSPPSTHTEAESATHPHLYFTNMQTF